MNNVFHRTTKSPCSVCLTLAKQGKIQPRAVMPLPEFPARRRETNEQCCADCQAADVVVGMGGHPEFVPARVATANDRLEGLLLPKGMMEFFGLCQMGLMKPCSLDDLENHIAWLDKHGIPNASCCHPEEEWGGLNAD
jgi:hypothetical protein